MDRFLLFYWLFFTSVWYFYYFILYFPFLFFFSKNGFLFSLISLQADLFFLCLSFSFSFSFSTFSCLSSSSYISFFFLLQIISSFPIFTSISTSSSLSPFYLFFNFSLFFLIVSLFFHVFCFVRCSKMISIFCDNLSNFKWEERLSDWRLKKSFVCLFSATFNYFPFLWNCLVWNFLFLFFFLLILFSIGQLIRSSVTITNAVIRRIIKDAKYQIPTFFL